MTVNYLYAAALVGALALAPTAHAQAEAPRPSLNIVCSAAKEWCELLAQRYGDAFKVSAKATPMPTNAALDAIRAKPGGFDVWFGGTGDPHLLAASEKLTERYKSPRLNELHDWAQRQAEFSDYRTVGIYAGMLGFVVNDELLKKQGLARPNCWFHLVRKPYANQVLSSNPNSSGTAYTMIATLIGLMGEDTAYVYMQTINVTMKQYTKSGGALAEMVAKGEAPIAIAFVHDGVRQQRKGAPITVIRPCEGTGYETGSVSIVRGGNVKEAQRFVDWVLSPAVQAMAAEAGQFQLPSNKRTPVPPGAPRFDDLSMFIAYDPRKFSVPDERKRLLARWDKEVMGTWKPPKPATELKK